MRGQNQPWHISGLHYACSHPRLLFLNQLHPLVIGTIVALLILVSLVCLR